MSKKTALVVIDIQNDITIHDVRIVLTCKLLPAEQFHDERVKKLATECFMRRSKRS